MLDSIQITIENKEYILKRTIRTLMLFEQMAGYSIDQAKDNVTDTIKLFYAMLKANNKESFTYEFDQFIDIIDNDESLFEKFNSYLMSLAGDNTEDTTTEQKKT